MSEYSVSLAKIIKETNAEVAYLPCEAENILITSSDVNRPGLPLSGFFDHFDNKRVQIIGTVEYEYLKGLSDTQRYESIDKFFSYLPSCVVISRGYQPLPEFMECARKYKTALLKVDESTSQFMAQLIAFLKVELAERITRHGVLVEVYGEGLLLLGESGVGKSETAMELLKRGHRLIADDAVEIRKVSSKTLVGSSPENIRHFIELRGIGIINVRRIFGIGAVKMTERIDLVIQLEIWDQNKNYDRMGMVNEYKNILGINVPSVTIPVKPGRNLAIIIETAAMNNRQKKMGYNAAKELLSRLGFEDQGEEEVKIDWDAF